VGVALVLLVAGCDLGGSGNEETAPADTSIAVTVQRDTLALPVTLLVPDTSAAVPDVVIVHGSGPIDRNGQSPVTDHPPIYKRWAERTRQQGIAVLRYDKRTTRPEVAQADPRDLTFIDSVRDAVAAARLLRDRERVDGDRIVFVGHSQGGDAAPAAATRLDDAAVVAALASPALAIDSLFVAQLEASGGRPGCTAAQAWAQFDLLRTDEATNVNWPTRLALPFFLITLVISFVGMALFGAAQAGVLPVPVPFEVPFLAQLAPAGVAVYLTWRRGGGSAAKDLLGRLVQWRVAPTWYAVALFTAPVMAGLVLFGNDVLGAETVAWSKLATLPSALGAALDGRIWAPGPLQSVVDAAWAGPAWVTVGVFGLFALMGGGLSEELGWRGYALSWIQTYYTTLTAGIVIALYWFVWHIAPPVWEILFT